jgi:hypothetical protein
MATTTNYGWTTPDDTDLVKDGAAAIRTLGSSVDTTTKNLNPETTEGDIAYRSSTANTNTRLALGTAGQVLTVNSGEDAPEWATPAGGGGITQLATGTLSGATTTISSISQDYKSLQLLVFNVTATGDYVVQFGVNSITTNYSLRGYATALISGSGSGWGLNPVASCKSNNTANRFTLNIPFYTSASPVALIANSDFSYLQDDNTTRFTGSATLINSSVSAAITSLSIVTNSTFNGGTYILNGIK